MPAGADWGNRYQQGWVWTALQDCDLREVLMPSRVKSTVSYPKGAKTDNKLPNWMIYERAILIILKFTAKEQVCELVIS